MSVGTKYRNRIEEKIPHYELGRERGVKEGFRKKVTLGMVLKIEVGYRRMKLIHQDQFRAHFLWEVFPDPTGTVKANFLLFEGQGLVLDINF